MTATRHARTSTANRRIPAFTALLLAVGIGTGVAAQAIAGRSGGTPWAQAPLVLGVLALASHLIIRFQYGEQVEALDLFEAVLAPTIVVFPGTAAVGLAALAKTLVGVVHRNEPVKAWFNAAQWAAATGCGALGYAGLGGRGGDLTARNLAALAAAMLVVAAVNHGAFTVVLSLAGGRPVREVLAGLRPVMLAGWLGGSAVNVTFGVLFVSAYVRSPAAIVVMVVPLVVLHWGSRGFATARTDRTRLTGLQAATHVLAGPVDPRDAIPRFLAEVQRCFEADAVDLLETTAAGPVRHRVGGDLPYHSGADDGASTAARLRALVERGSLVVDTRHDAAGILAAEGWRIAAVAPVRLGERDLGVLCVYNRGGAEGFEEGEVVVLEALAAEVAGALEKAELLQATLEERRQLADIVGRTSDGIVTLDEHGAVTSWNAGIEQITGYGAGEMRGRVPDVVLHPRNGQGEPVSLGGWYGRAGTLPVDVEVVAADRQLRWLSCSYGELPPRDGRGAQLVVMARDVTQVHELEKLKNDFVAVVSHELRTPLAAIKGWATALMDHGHEMPPDQQQDGTRAIVRQADRLEQLIMNILEDSRIERDVDNVPTEETVDLVVSVAKVVEDFAVVVPDRAIVVRGADAAAIVVGRAVRIEQVVSNLIANAVKYSPPDEPIEVDIERGHGAVSVAVTDHGPGIPAEARERIFGRFERLSDSPAQTGTGLGLYIARQLATTMGGELDVAPAPGGGSTFTLRMRAVRHLAAVG